MYTLYSIPYTYSLYMKIIYKKHNIILKVNQNKISLKHAYNIVLVRKYIFTIKGN